MKFRGFLSRLTAALPAFPRGSRRAQLDARHFSDHLKRDMGFIDSLPTGKRR